MAISVPSFSVMGAAGGDVAVVAPTGVQIDDLLLAIGQADPDGTTWAAPGDWTQIGSTFTSTQGDIKWWRRTATQTDVDLSGSSGTYTFTGDANSSRVYTILRITGQNVSAPIDVGPSNTSGTASQSEVAPTVSASLNGNLLVCCWMCLNADNVTTVTFTKPASMTKDADWYGDNAVQDTHWQKSLNAHETVAPGATGTRTATTDVTKAWTAGSLIVARSGPPEGSASGAVGWAGQAVGTNLAAPGNFTATVVSDSEIDLDWDAVTGAAGYHVYRDDALVQSTASTAWNDTGLDPNTEYCYYVVAWE